MFMLVSHGVLEKIRHEPDVAGFCVRPTFSDPYKLYTVGLSIDNIQSMLDKYDIEAIMCPKKTINIEY